MAGGLGVYLCIPSSLHNPYTIYPFWVGYCTRYILHQIYHTTDYLTNVKYLPACEAYSHGPPGNNTHLGSQSIRGV
jgi:hypothetical protein